MRRLTFIILVLLLGLYLLSGIRILNQREYWNLLDSRIFSITPHLLESRVSFSPFPFFSIFRYAKENQISLLQDLEKPFKSREGAEFFIQGEITYHFDETKIISAHSSIRQDHLYPVSIEIFYEALQDIFSNMVMPNPDMRMKWFQLGKEAEKNLASDMKKYGIILQSFQLERVFFKSDSDQLPKPLDAKILLIGLDGADWDILNPLLNAGKLPHLKKIIEKGSTGRLLTVTPTLSPIIWTSIATGKMPEKHGIMDFLAIDERTGQKVPITSNLRKTRALWNILSEIGLRVGIIGWWATWPAEEVNGYIVTERVAYQLFGITSSLKSEKGKTFPSDLYSEIVPFIIEPSAVTWQDIKRFFNAQVTLEHFLGEREKLLEETKTLYASSESFKEIYHHLDEEDVDFQAVYFEGTDTISHLYMPYRKPKMKTVSEEDVRIFGDSVDYYYQYIDQALGELLSGKDDSWTIIICSDHGFKSGKERPTSYLAVIDEGKAALWHDRYGIFIAAGPNIKKNAYVKEGRVVDIFPTILALYGLPIGADMDGKVLDEIILPEFLQDNPIRYISTYEREVAVAGSEAPIESEMDQEIKEKLLSLGYLSESSDNSFNNRGLVLLSKGDYEKAIKEFQKALDMNPYFTGAKINIGIAWMQRGEIGLAISVFKEVLEGEPENAMVENLIGNAYMNRADYLEAEEHFLQALKIEPASADALNSLGILYENIGKLDEAINQYKKVIEIEPSYAEGYNNIGNIWKKKGNGEEAVRWYEKAIEADPFFIGSYNNLALIHQERGEFQKAIMFYMEALEKAPANAIVMNNLGSLYFRQGDMDAAMEMWKKSIEIMPTYESPYNNLGAAYGKLGMLDEEMEMYQKALQLNPDYVDARLNLGLAYIRRGESGKGTKELHIIVKNNPTLVNVWLLLAKYYFARKDYNEGLQNLEKALDDNPGNVSLLNMAGEAALLMGNKRKALEYFKRSLQANPDQNLINTRVRSLSKE